jgi:hypothetical protein
LSCSFSFFLFSFLKIFFAQQQAILVMTLLYYNTGVNYNLTTIAIMSNVYEYAAKPFEISSDEDEDDRDALLNEMWKPSKKRKTRVSKYKKDQVKRAHIEITSDSDSDAPIIFHDDEDADITLSIGATARSKASDIMKLTVEAIEPIGSVTLSKATEREMKRAKEALENFRSQRRELDTVGISIVEEPTNSGFSLTETILSSLPQVKKAADRIIPPFERPKYLSQAQPAHEQEEAEVQMIKLKTVLNGDQEWKWRISVNESFAKVCAM